MAKKPTYKELEQEVNALGRAGVENREADIAFIESALDTLTDAFFIFNLEGRFLRWNKTINEVTGYNNDEISTMKPTDFIFNEDIPKVSEAIESVVKEGSASMAASIITKDGQVIPYEFTGGLLKDTDGNPLGICVVGRDITNRIKAEEALRKSEERLRAIFEASPNPIVVYNN